MLRGRAVYSDSTVCMAAGRQREAPLFDYRRFVAYIAVAGDLDPPISAALWPHSPT